MRRKPNRNDSVATIDIEGRVSNARIHEQMTEGVDDYDFRMETRAKLLAQGVPLSALDRVLPVSPLNTRGARCEFDKRVMEQILPQFCTHYGYDVAAFNSQTLNRISEYDALWFLKALEAKVVRPDGAFFYAAHSGAKEQIFWQYGKPGSLRRMTLSVEPVISIGAAGRLHIQFGWPKDRIGLQSQKNWAFDLVAYDDHTASKASILCEVKKQKNEIDYLIQTMQEYFTRPPLRDEPSLQKLRNAYKKVEALRETKPELLWILGPENYGKLFRVVEATSGEAARLQEIGEDELRWRGSELALGAS